MNETMMKKTAAVVPHWLVFYWPAFPFVTNDGQKDEEKDEDEDDEKTCGDDRIINDNDCRATIERSVAKKGQEKKQNLNEQGKSL